MSLTYNTNPIVTASIDIFLYTDLINSSMEIDEVRNTLTNQVDNFKHALSASIKEHDYIQNITYLLCCVLDEFILTSEWGRNHYWASNTLLSRFYHDTRGGRDFFTLLQAHMNSPAQHIDALEFILMCINIGFHGKFLLMSDGDLKLKRLKSDLYHIVKQHKPQPEKPSKLAHRIKRHKPKTKHLHLKLFIGCAILAGIIFSISTILLNQQVNLALATTQQVSV